MRDKIEITPEDGAVLTPALAKGGDWVNNGSTCYYTPQQDASETGWPAKDGQNYAGLSWSRGEKIPVYAGEVLIVRCPGVKALLEGHERGGT